LVAADIPATMALFRDTIRRINCRDYTLEQVMAWAPDDIDESRWARKLSSRLSLVAEWDAVLLGFGDIEEDGHLDHLYVHADHQGAGIGRALVQGLEAAVLARGCRRVFTEASITARPFFERHGYHVLQQQTVVCRGIGLVNYRMEKCFEVQ
jgi:putative acetyltransferase